MTLNFAVHTSRRFPRKWAFISMEEYVSTKTACKELGLRYGQVIRLIRSKKLKAHKPPEGWGWLIDKQSMLALKCNKQ
jgi:excisionase family DNA binding protein